MSTATTERLDATFAALADPTRRAIVARLAVSDATVTELAAPFAISQPAVSKHLKVLERAGLVTRSREAQRRPCRLDAGPLRDATAWLANYRDYWDESYRQLDALLADLTADAGPANDAGPTNDTSRAADEERAAPPRDGRP
ncbi:metalloregulator ArsR/SmtB family transcription factor [Promicromonospora xylanilytica]